MFFENPSDSEKRKKQGYIPRKNGGKMARSRFFALSMFFAFSLAVLTGLVTTLTADEETIGDVTVTANPESFAGPCPVTIKFTGTIQVLNYPMTFNYHWERSDGGKGQVHVVRVPSVHTRTVTVVETWNVGGSHRRGQTFKVWEKLYVNCGNTHVVSTPSVATVTCQ